MKIKNYNDYIRNYVGNLIYFLDDNYKEEKEKSINELCMLFDKLKDNSELSKYISGVLYETSYITQNAILKRNPDDKNTIKKLNKLKSYRFIEDFIYEMDNDMFIFICGEVLYFNELDLSFKKTFLMDSINEEDKDKILELFPSYLLDILYYFNRYDASLILDEYEERLYNNEENAKENTIYFCVEALIELEKQDFNAYKYIMLDMLEVYYKYEKYLIKNDYINKDLINTKIISMIEEDLLSTVYYSVNNKVILNSIVNGYLSYSLLSEPLKNNINKFYAKEDMKKSLIKVIKKSNKLKEC